ncbi:hypothetical protein Cgig2_001284 [Carnegiea gigantea]|uniref:Reverse transcriptase n=1 Tax=Carnegiea gigantea TaxID=171969 RepID=A0A9Q1QLH5_9CARY|nr:hypothetical protein Cgig2_001284 [Carnegiea gigantea]
MLKYALLLVEMPLEGHFPEYIEFANEKNTKDVYEWKLIKCTHCRMFGHTREECRKIVSQRQEWRAKVPQATSQSQHQQAKVPKQTDEEVFQPVTRHTTRHQILSNVGQGSSTPATKKLLANTFKWIGLKDECTRMFMARIKQRKAMTCIFHIRDTNGHRVEGFKEISEVMTSFYQDLLGRTKYHRTCVEPLVIEAGHSLTFEQQVQLYKPFSNNDIKQMIFSIPNHKSPGPDGFNSGFYKAC